MASLPGWAAAPRGRAIAGRVVMAADTIGYRVPHGDFSGRVHSVFAQACNITWRSTLLTLASSATAMGPTVLRLARTAPLDLRSMFDVGEPVECRHGALRSRHTELCLGDAAVWRPAPLRERLPSARIEAHLGQVQRGLARHRCLHASVIDGAGAGEVDALRAACRALDGERAQQHVARLIGWGEGLTPAGDDFLVGLVAGLDALVGADERRRDLRRTIAHALCRGAPRTTPIAAHYLRLAAQGHYSEPLLRLRAALLCDDSADAVDAALRNALAVGATSGADTVSGLLTALQAWLPMPSTAAAA